ncbi:MAG TPA: tripartite tricarboxylate transporter substrate binding protein [Ramlibacter sp.]|nr:tripartite tricarboxylate transporter substrate binding protein [Ramlibacter sp.]
MPFLIDRRRALTAMGCALLAGRAFAQSWPARAIKLVVPFPAGGSTDIVGRIVADKLAVALGQPVVVDNRGGAGGTSGSDVVAKSPADGYSLLVATSSTHAIAPSLYPKLPYDPLRDFTPVSLVGTATILLVTHPSVPVKTVSELIAYAKAHPGQLMFGSTGNGSVSHLTAEYFKSSAGIDMQHIPYKGDSPLSVDLIAGRVQVAFGTAVAFLPYVQQGKLNALAVTDAKPSPIAPNLPTVASSGLPGFEALQWFGILAPAGTPKEVVVRLNAEIGKILQMPDVVDRLRGLGIAIDGGTSDSFAAFLRAEHAKWGKIVKTSGAKVD